MKRTLRSAVPLIALALGSASFMTACGDSDHVRVGDPPAPPAPTTTSFTAFIKSRLNATSETTAPADINAITFTFEDDNNASAYNEVLPP